ncbi:HEXB-like protein [Mya arenaria]|uniref:Beta-hexosaminidase n=1 Tax=Mya arenaria TaxID=6604 RepID=A0ABY7DWF1_MYAAR|nr:HEXB-like protein [Mya arenaria]
MADMERVFCVMFSCLVVVLCNTQEQYRGKNGRDFTDKIQGSAWPQPKSLTTSMTQRTLDASVFQFRVSTPSERCDIIDQAFIRYRNYVFGTDVDTLKFKPKSRHASRSDPLLRKATPLEALTVKIDTNCDGYPNLDSDESYTLQITEDGTEASIQASQVWGALRGLETFSQLFVVNATAVNDVPRFKHRGVLLDTSRHFLSMRVLKENLELMSQNKFNVFHWHIVDDQSFPYESNTFPDMSVKGAYSPRHVYTYENVKEIIEFARLRGIRVIPEYDTPGHTQSWGKAIEDLLTKCYKGTEWTGEYGPINPALNSTFDFLEKFFTEISQVFPDHYMHLGGDEVSFTCWESNPDITKFMQAMGFGKKYSALEEYYMQRLINIVNGVKKGYMIWQEVIDNGAKAIGQSLQGLLPLVSRLYYLPLGTLTISHMAMIGWAITKLSLLNSMVADDSVVHIWKRGLFEAELAKVTGLGYKAILSAPWYVNIISYGDDWKKYYKIEPLSFNGENCTCKGHIDTVIGVWKGGYQEELTKVTALGYKTLLLSPWYVNYISYGQDWTKYYQIEPLNFNGTASQKALIMGGETCIWGEFVDDTNLTPRLWPRASAIAERLWSPANVNDSGKAMGRLEEHRCRLIRRGFPAEPVNGPGFCDYEY